MFRIDDDEVVDATLRGNAARFINHCCEVRTHVSSDYTRRVLYYTPRRPDSHVSESIGGDDVCSMKYIIVSLTDYGTMGEE